MFDEFKIWKKRFLAVGVIVLLTSFSCSPQKKNDSDKKEQLVASIKITSPSIKVSGKIYPFEFYTNDRGDNLEAIEFVNWKEIAESNNVVVQPEVKKKNEQDYSNYVLVGKFQKMNSVVKSWKFISDAFRSHSNVFDYQQLKDLEIVIDHFRSNQEEEEYFYRLSSIFFSFV